MYISQLHVNIYQSKDIRAAVNVHTLIHTEKKNIGMAYIHIICMYWLAALARPV